MKVEATGLDGGWQGDVKDDRGDVPCFDLSNWGCHVEMRLMRMQAGAGVGQELGSRSDPFRHPSGGVRGAVRFMESPGLKVGIWGASDAM